MKWEPDINISIVWSLVCTTTRDVHTGHVWAQSWRCAALTGCLDWLLHLVFDNFLKTRCWFEQHQCGRGEFMRHRIHLCVKQKEACLQMMPATSVDHTCLVLKPKTKTVWHCCFHRACLSHRKCIFSLNPLLPPQTTFTQPCPLCPGQEDLADTASIHDYLVIPSRLDDYRRRESSKINREKMCHHFL